MWYLAVLVLESCKVCFCMLLESPTAVKEKRIVNVYTIIEVYKYDVYIFIVSSIEIYDIYTP